ncbi:hypothetical protein NPX13_g6352 [Xylaria arbuscula]|uniref:Uncharacterized protein n=1 Tax=Xylaria arbuscula TaxID=114810 RepID=A0A9W8NC09_9PEZI|nr:hypothetical protein NPX13_g6352 [Xylaria arbuscula]
MLDTETGVSKSFIEGGDFFPPGASLSPARLPIPIEPGSKPLHNEWEESALAYGYPIPITGYWNASSSARRKIASVAREAHVWTILNTIQCQTQYLSCNPRTIYGDVVIVVETGADNSSGWTRSEVFNFQPSANISSDWNLHVPPNSVNSLWFSTQCSITRGLSRSGRHDTCRNTCFGALGSNITSCSGTRVNFFGPLSVFECGLEQLPSPQEPWFLDFRAVIAQDENLTLYTTHGFNPKFDSLRVSHCLAKPEQPICKVGVSNLLLLVILGCLFLKVFQITIIVWKLSDASLVTPGDAINSFISMPDPRTTGLCTLDITDSERLEHGPRTYGIRDAQYPMIHARKIKTKQVHLLSAVTLSAWVRTYGILVFSFILLAVGLGYSSDFSSNNYSYSWNHDSEILSVGIPPNYSSALLLANTPQLLLSLCYFSYNALITRLQVEKEWNLFSSGFRSLQVSYPTGLQVSSYRLQLPYRYSIPMILVSILLHWLLSNALFIYIIEGGFVSNDWGHTFSDTPGSGLSTQFGVPEGSFIDLGYSPIFILVLFVARFIFIICPPLVLGLQKLKYKMVTGDCNSLVLSAACHQSDLSTDRQINVEYTRHPLQNSSDSLRGEDQDTAPLNRQMTSEAETRSPLKLAEQQIRWGAMDLPYDVAACITMEEEQMVFHLGFGGLEDDIREPNDEQYYA